jgi:hypothetical protein
MHWNVLCTPVPAGFSNILCPSTRSVPANTDQPHTNHAPGFKARPLLDTANDARVLEHLYRTSTCKSQINAGHEQSLIVGGQKKWTHNLIAVRSVRPHVHFLAQFH